MNKFSHLARRCDKLIFASALALSLIGLFTQFAISRTETTFLSGEVLIQSAALIIGLAAAAVILMQGYRYFIEPDKLIYIASIVLLLLVYVPGLGASAGASRSWIAIGPATFQPSEVVKIAFVLLMASHLSRRGGRGEQDHFACGDVVRASLYGLPFILLVAKEDFGSGCVFCAIWIFMVFCSGLELKIIGRFALVLTALLPMIYFFMAGYQKDRIDAFLSPDDLDLPGNYQVWNSKVAIGSAGLFGRGLYPGTQSRLGFLPVPESDFIFAATVEILGFVGGVAVIVLFGLLIYRSLKITRYAKDLQGALTAAGITGMFFFQAFENIAMTMGLMPVTGITLPFMSSGGSAMVSAWMGVGLLLSVSCRQRL